MVTDTHNRRAQAAAAVYEREFTAQGIHCVQTSKDEPKLPERFDLVLVFGGDRTILRAIQEPRLREAPILAVSYGNVGALGNSPETVSSERIASGAYIATLFPLLSFVATDIHGMTHEGFALNDIAVRADTRMPGAAHLRVVVDHDVLAEELIGDGIVLATPLGSTAYNKNAGGAVLDIGLESFVLTAIAAPLPYPTTVHNPGTEVTIEVLRSEESCVNLSFDSSVIVELSHVSVSYAADAVQLAFMQEPTFIPRLKRLLAQRRAVRDGTKSQPSVGTARDGSTMHYTVGAVIEQDGRYLLIERAEFPPGFAGPAGHVDLGEDPLPAMIREVTEEVGLHVTSSEVLFDEEVPNNPCGYGITTHHWVLYRVQTSGDLHVDKHEAKSFGWFTPAQLAELQLETVWEYWFKKLGILE